MIIANGKKYYYAGKVEHKVSKKGEPYVSFILGDKEEMPDKSWKSIGPIYGCTVFKDIPLEKGSKYVINEIKSISHREYNGKTYFNLVLDIELCDGNANAGTQSQNQTQTQSLQSSLDSSNTEWDFGIGEEDIQF